MKSMMTFRDALALAQAKEMEMDQDVFVFGLDVPDHKRIFGSTAGLVEKFGAERIRTLSHHDIEERVKDFIDLVQFDIVLED